MPSSGARHSSSQSRCVISSMVLEAMCASLLHNVSAHISAPFS
jgi:hypothetical protein